MSSINGIHVMQGRDVYVVHDPVFHLKSLTTSGGVVEISKIRSAGSISSLWSQSTSQSLNYSAESFSAFQNGGLGIRL